MMIDGFIRDIRDCPHTIQEAAFRQGLIPWIPADQPRPQPVSDDTQSQKKEPEKPVKKLVELEGPTLFDKEVISQDTPYFQFDSYGSNDIVFSIFYCLKRSGH